MMIGSWMMILTFLVKVYIFSSGYVSFGEGRTAGSWMTWFGMKIRQSFVLPKDGIIVWCSTIRPWRGIHLRSCVQAFIYIYRFMNVNLFVFHIDIPFHFHPLWQKIAATLHALYGTVAMSYVMPLRWSNHAPFARGWEILLSRLPIPILLQTKMACPYGGPSSSVVSWSVGDFVVLWGEKRTKNQCFLRYMMQLFFFETKTSNSYLNALS